MLARLQRARVSSLLRALLATPLQPTLAGAVALLSAFSSVYWGPNWPLPVRFALIYTTMVGRFS